MPINYEKFLELESYEDMRKGKVYVDPACNKNYMSFYIKGLYELYGRRNVKFTSKYFEELNYDLDAHYLAFIIEGKKYVIDAADSNKLFKTIFLEWADVFGKVNYKKENLPVQYNDKIKRIGPNFGIGIYGRNKYAATIYALMDYVKCGNRLNYKFSSFLSPYLWLYKRAGIEWIPATSTVGSREIFMVSRWWDGQSWVNEARVNFIRACKRLESEGLIKFKGGMVPDSQENSCPMDVIMDKEIPMAEYMKGISNSLIVFNTPAYHHCHGWKLPEYFATGKIILSTPFENELPQPLEHGKNVYFSDTDEESLYNAIKRIVDDQPLQKRLEAGSREYWEKYANPEKAVKLFME